MAFQEAGSKVPLFTVHPGSGDVLIFVALAKYFPDRPVYGIRTRCLYKGDDFHKTIASMASLYYHHIKQIQPQGPYAIAGYSLGSTVAFEIGKLLESDGSQVPFGKHLRDSSSFDTFQPALSPKSSP